jgi:tetratricopeptide (TPR) repeat protein
MSLSVRLDNSLASWRPYALLFIASCSLYGHILSFTEFTYFDDYILIARNFSHIDELSDIPRELFEDAGHQGQGGNLYRPLLTITFILSAQLSGLELWGYHLLNVLFHAFACMLLFFMLLVMKFERSKSFVAALLFCVHPALTQAVAWISGRNDSLLAIVLLPTFITYIRFLETGRIHWYVFSLLLFFFSLLTKETAIAFPLLALALSVWVEKKPLISRQTFVWILGWTVVVINWQLMRYIAQIAPIGDLWYAIKTILSHWSVAFAFYGKIFWPFDLAFAPVEQDLSIVAGVLSLAGTVALFLFSKDRRWGLAAFCILWFGLFLAPTFFHHDKLFYPPKFYEHRLYVPMIGVVILFVSFKLPEWAGRLRSVLPPATTLVVIVLSWMSWTHSFDYKNSITLREYAARTSPSDETLYAPLHRMHLPAFLRTEIDRMRQTPSEKASEAQEKSLTSEEIRNLVAVLEKRSLREPGSAELKHARAIVYFGRGFLIRAVEHFERVLEEQREDAHVRFNLGVLYYDAHMPEKAKHYWMEAIQREPTMADAHHNLCFLYYEQGAYEEAWGHCKKAMEFGASVPPDLLREVRSRLQKQVVE